MYLVAVAMDILQICLTGYATGVENEVEDLDLGHGQCVDLRTPEKAVVMVGQKRKSSVSRLKTFLQ